MNLKQTLYLRAFGLLKVPLIALVNPSVIRLDDRRCEVKIPLNYLTRNHLKSMYFGTLAIGADCAGGLLAMHLIGKTGKRVSIIFKDFQAEFLKRPEADTHFTCSDGAKVHRAIRQAIRTGGRVNVPLTILATVPKRFGRRPVAPFWKTGCP